MVYDDSDRGGGHVFLRVCEGMPWLWVFGEWQSRAAVSYRYKKQTGTWEAAVRSPHLANDQAPCTPYWMWVTEDVTGGAIAHDMF